MSAMQNDVALKRPSTRCMVAENNLITGQAADERSVTEVRMTKVSFLKILENNVAKHLFENGVFSKVKRVAGNCQKHLQYRLSHLFQKRSWNFVAYEFVVFHHVGLIR